MPKWALIGDSVMPIVGFRRKPRLLRIGKIHLGERAISDRTGKEYPKDLEHFRVPPEVAAVYGDAPTEFEIRVPSADIDEWFPFQLERWGTGEKLWCRGDGETACRYDEETNTRQDIPCGHKECEFYLGRKCTEIGRLRVYLPDVNMMGVYEITTGSWHAINGVYEVFETALAVLRSVMGHLADQAISHVPFVLAREPKTVEFVDQDGKRKTRQKAILVLRAPALTLDEMEALARRVQAGPVGFLPAGAPGAEPAAMSDEVAVDDSGDEVLQGEYISDDPDEPGPMPKDQVPGATPAGPTMGQRAAWAALLEQVQAMGKSVTVLESQVCKAVTKNDTERFDDLSEAEATAAIDQATQMIVTWQQQAAPQEQAPAQTQARRPTTRAKQAPTPAPAPEPEPEPEPVGAGIPTGQGGLGF